MGDADCIGAAVVGAETPGGSWRARRRRLGFGSEQAAGKRGYLTLSDRPLMGTMVNAIKELEADNDNLGWAST